MSDKETIKVLTEALEMQPENKKLRKHIIEAMAKINDLEGLKLLVDNHLGDEDVVLMAVESENFDNDTCLLLAELALDKNKANAQAYMVKSRYFCRNFDKEQATKFYKIACVIDESLESEAYERVLNMELTSSSLLNEDAPKEDVQEVSDPVPVTHLGEQTDIISGEEVIEADDFIETKASIDDLLSQKMISFDDVGGMETLKERIRMNIIYPFKNKELFKKFNKKMGGGILLYGPPGCGKTLISKATAGECGAHFINISIQDILSKWIGESETRVHQLFETARRKSPTIVFIDEIDALCVKRSDAGHTASLVNTLLTEIDGAASNNEDVLVIGATNTPWRIDSAFRRPGRFDHVLFVPPPDTQARQSIFELILEGVPQEAINFTRISKLCTKYSGADIRAVVDAASEVAIEQIMKTGRETKVTEKSIVQAIKKHRATTLEWLEQAANYASYANQSGLYDELAEYIRNT